MTGLAVTSRSGAVLKTPIAREDWELKNDDVQLVEKIGRGNFGDVYKGGLISESFFWLWFLKQMCQITTINFSLTSLAYMLSSDLNFECWILLRNICFDIFLTAQKWEKNNNIFLVKGFFQFCAVKKIMKKKIIINTYYLIFQMKNANFGILAMVWWCAKDINFEKLK